MREPMPHVLQPELFNAAAALPPAPGLTYVKNVVSAGEERELAAFIAGLELQHFAFRGFTGKRRTVSFGWRYDFDGGGFQRADAMPSELIRARDRLSECLGLASCDFAQCSVIEYAPGAGIGWHKDRPQFGKVAGLSLLAPCRFRLRREGEEGEWRRASVDLEPRSAYLLEGDARSQWQHSILALDRLRYSITFRTLAQ